MLVSQIAWQAAEQIVYIIFNDGQFQEYLLYNSVYYLQKNLVNVNNVLHFDQDNEKILIS